MRPTSAVSIRLLRIVILLSVLGVADGCRRGAKPAPTENVAETAIESGAPQTVQVGGSAVILAPAPQITNNVAPPPRVDTKTGKLILQGDAPVVRKKTAAE